MFHVGSAADVTMDHVHNVTCDSCSAVAEGVVTPLGWVTTVDDGRMRHFCDRCSRQNLRAIEAKLDPAWW
ncbi:MAG: hypothetical protein ICV70_05660 [Jiangellaceae bacterium]|nr:hypothetical protein [Jiangellaceae bacterium]